MIKGKDLQPRLLHQAKLLFRIKLHLKSIPDNKKLREFTTKPVHVIGSSLRRKKDNENMNNKMAINTYLSTIESKKQTKQ